MVSCGVSHLPRPNQFGGDSTHSRAEWSPFVEGCLHEESIESKARSRKSTSALYAAPIGLEKEEALFSLND